MTELTPLETQYAGCAFRSRLEARWAVFFDALHIKWRYEPDAFRLPSGRCYLPDFYLDGIGYVEIKPSPESDDGKLREFGGMLNVIGEHAYCIVGTVPSPSAVEPCGLRWSSEPTGIYAADDDSTDYWFAICPKCGARGITYQARFPRLSCGCFASMSNDRAWNENIARILVACTAARSARFDR